MVMNRNLQGIIAVGVLGVVAYFTYRWVKRGGVDRLLGVSQWKKQVIANESGTPYYRFFKESSSYETTPKGFTKKGEKLGAYFGGEQTVTLPTQKFRAVRVYLPDESAIVIDKTKVTLK